MKKQILVLLVLFIDTNYPVAGQLYEGDNCKEQRSNSVGICKLLSQCQSAIDNLRKRIYPTLCGFQGVETVVCCSTANIATTSTTRSTTTIRTTTAPVATKRNTGEISKKMCQNYSQYVWLKEISPTLLAGAEDIVRRDCPFDRLQLVVGGSPASRREFPHMVQIGYTENPIVWGCGGALISHQHVLTAAHCLEERSLGVALYARMGIIDLDDPEHLQQYNIIERIFHPQYAEPSHYHDIGIIKLNKPAQLSTWVRPACLYTHSTSPSSNVIAIGWGKTDFGGLESTVLLRVVLELYNETKCGKVYKHESKTAKLRDGIKDELMICAGHSEELKDTCQGDSGGPLQVYKTEANMSCMYDLIGVTSFGKGCGIDVNIPGVYTRVSNYLKWIEDIVWPIN